jgi:hypothetical protein
VGRQGPGRLCARGIAAIASRLRDRLRPRLTPEPCGADARPSSARPAPEAMTATTCVGAAQLGLLQLHPPHRGLDRHRRLGPLRLPGRSASPRRWYLARPKDSSTSASKAVWNTSRTLSRGDVLQARREVTVGAEQLVDLGVDALDRRYSPCHGCRSSPVLGGSREPTPVAHLHQEPDATQQARLPAPAIGCCKQQISLRSRGR